MIPNDWIEVNLLESLDKIIDYRGQSVPKADSGIPLITARNVRKGFLSFKNREFVDEDEYVTWMKRGLPQEGDVLFTTEAPLGYSAMFPTDQKYAVGQRTVTLRPKKDVLDGKFLMYFLLGPGHNRVKSRATGSTALGIKSSELKKLKIFYPALNEQRKIAEILSTWDEAIEENKKLIVAKKLRHKGLMQQLLTGKKRFDGFSEEWCKGKLSEFVDVDCDSLKSSTDDNYKFFYISLSDVADGKIQKQNSQISFSESPSRARKLIQKGDVLLSTVRPNLKAFAKIDEDAKNVVVSTGFAVLRPTKRITSSFLYHYILGDHISRQIESMVVGSNYPAINTSEVKALHVNLPSIEEQKKIALVLDSSASEITALMKMKELLSIQRKGLMQQLLTGKKRVKID